MLNTIVEGGDLTLTSISRNYESVTQFVNHNETQAKQLLEVAQVALENAELKLNSAKKSRDDYMLGMVSNYGKVIQASHTMAQGVDNLLAVSQNLTAALDYYSKKDYEKAAQEASYCLETLTPLLSEFVASNATLNSVDYSYIPSGQRDRLTLGVKQFTNETEIYVQYLLILRSLVEGKDYLQMNELLEEYLRELQDAISKNDYESAQNLLEEISKLLQSLKDTKYQNITDTASQLDPNKLNGTDSDFSQDLRDKLKGQEQISVFETYLQGLEKYLNALSLFKQGDKTGAEQEIDMGLGILGLGPSPGDNAELQSLYAGLIEAFNSLREHMRSEPGPG